VGLPDLVVWVPLGQELQLLRVQDVLDQQRGVGVVHGCSEDGGVVGERLAEVKRELDVQVLDNLGNHDEAELVEGEPGLVGFKLECEFGLLHGIALFHQFDHEEVGHVVVGEGLEFVADDLDHHVEVNHLLEVVHLVLQRQAELLVGPALLEEILDFLLLEHVVGEQTPDQTFFAVEGVDVVDLVLVDGSVFVHDLTQHSLLRALPRLEEELGVFPGERQFAVRVEHFELAQVCAFELLKHAITPVSAEFVQFVVFAH